MFLYIANIRIKPIPYKFSPIFLHTQAVLCQSGTELVFLFYSIILKCHKRMTNSIPQGLNKKIKSNVVKDFICCLPEFQIISCVSNFFKKISPKDLPMVCFVVTQHSESALSLCLRYSKTSCARATPKNIRLTSV